LSYIFVKIIVILISGNTIICGRQGTLVGRAIALNERR